MVSKDKLVDFFQKQINIENEIVSLLRRPLEEMRNPAVKGVLKGISLDSRKHSEMYSAAIKLLTSVSPALAQKNLDEQKELVEKHMRMEAELIRELNKQVPSIENEKVKLLVKGILQDEKRHHQLLKEVLEILVRGETITEEDWWGILWKNVPFHGAPGG
ncbi:MAG: ferritin-like domain-containing protein [Candidatus Bathyarchaeota archaeon]|nr:MAG: ferritin-like domain-containing protein [Candidatus Bathyarchaeota archaeon]